MTGLTSATTHAVRADTDSTTAGGGGGHSRRVHRNLAGDMHSERVESASYGE
jgi:hypothetical protein